MAVHMEGSSEEPAIGECLAITSESVSVRWYKGDYSSAWAPYKVPDPTDRRKKIFWEQNIPRNSIILYSFQLTAIKHLKKATVKHLKAEYNKLRTE